MASKIQIKAVEMARRIHDEQARMLAGKSAAELIDFLQKLEKPPGNTKKGRRQYKRSHKRAANST